MNKSTIEKILLKPTEVVEALGLSRSKVYQLLAAREIESIRIGRSVRVPVEAIQAWLAKQREQATKEN